VVKINGRVVYEGDVTGNMSISNGEVRIDGRLITGDEAVDDGPDINIEIVGDVGDIKIDRCKYINVHSAKEITTRSGSVSVGGNVLGDVTASSGDIDIAGSSGEVCTSSGSVRVGNNVTGKVKTTSGSVKAKSIAGAVRTSSGSVTNG
jgi:hypothetical protein